MKKPQSIRFITVAFTMLVLAACTDEPDSSSSTVKSIDRNEYLKQGKKLENPYSVKNMRKAFSNLKEKTKSVTSKEALVPVDDLEIEPNYRYVEITPTTASQEAEIKRDSSLIVFDYPLDYEFTDEVLDARPELAPDEFPVYYSAIKINSDVASEAYYQTLEELYIPEEDPYFDNDSGLLKKMDKQTIEKRQLFLDQLLEEAYRLTGNEYESKSEGTTTNRIILGSRWWPSGTITIYDEVVGRNVPVVGAQILIRQWFTVRQAITNENGYFKTSSVRGSARYIIQWERYDYSIRNGSLFQAELRGPMKKDEAWNYTINAGSGDSDDKYHALIHQAAHDYYYGHRFGLISPPKNNQIYSFGRQGQIKIAARENQGSFPSSYSHLRNDLTFGIAPQIHIKAWGRTADLIYGTTIHELTHAAHSVLDRGTYDNLVRDAYFNSSSIVSNRNKRLLETWPTTVEIAMTLDRYKTKFSVFSYEYQKRSPNSNSGNRQLYTINEENHYTSAGFDMIDSYNQREFYGFSYPIDRVNGYSIKQLQDALVKANYWTQWRDNIKNKYDNPTELYLDELFNNWQD